MNKYGLILLSFACLYMAGLNLWLLFKDWFNEKYQKKDRSQPSEQKQEARVGKSRTDIPDIVGKSKFQLQSTPKQEKNEPKTEQPFHSENLEREAKAADVDLEKEAIPLTIPTNNKEQSSTYDQSVTVDEFQLLADTLQGKAIPKHEEAQAKETLQKMQDTELFNQFAKQVKGAEGRALEILRLSEDNKSDKQSDTNNLSKFIRK